MSMAKGQKAFALPWGAEGPVGDLTLKKDQQSNTHALCTSYVHTSAVQDKLLDWIQACKQHSAPAQQDCTCAVIEPEGTS